MSRIDEAREILNSIDMPSPQQNDICCYTLLALSNVTEKNGWESADNSWLRIVDIMQFTAEKYNNEYAPNTRETFRKNALHYFRTANIVEDNNKATNSPNYRYRITDDFLNLIRCYGNDDWDRSLGLFIANQPTLTYILSSKKKMNKHAIMINDIDYEFSTGKHNELLKQIIEEFMPRFAPHSSCIYIGDTAAKDLIKDVETLRKLGFSITLHDKMPDVVLYDAKNDWLYFIEAVTSSGPMDAKRIHDINVMTKNVKSGKIFITAFLDFKIFKRFSENLAWETEVWISDLPEHMIHMNGDRFLGPR